MKAFCADVSWNNSSETNLVGIVFDNFFQTVNDVKVSIFVIISQVPCRIKCHVVKYSSFKRAFTQRLFKKPRQRCSNPDYTWPRSKRMVLNRMQNKGLERRHSWRSTDACLWLRGRPLRSFLVTMWKYTRRGNQINMCCKTKRSAARYWWYRNIYLSKLGLSTAGEAIYNGTWKHALWRTKLVYMFLTLILKDAQDKTK